MKEETMNNKTVNEVINDAKMNAIEQIVADEERMENAIAEMYLQKHPRKELYGVYLESTEDDSEMTIYKELTEDEVAVITKAHEVMDEEGIDLDEYLEGEGYEELRDKLLEHNTPYCLNIVKDVNLSDKLKFAKFTVQVQNEDGTMRVPVVIGFPMTDEEYKRLFILLMRRSNELTVNQLMFMMPELGQRLAKHIDNAYFSGVIELNMPYICEMTELKKAVNSVMNPFFDNLGLFVGEDEKMRDYAIHHQIVPDNARGQELFAEHAENEDFHCLLYLEGTSVRLYQEGIVYELLSVPDWNNIDRFECDAKALMEKFGIEKPEDIYPYLKEHFGTRDCLQRVRDAMAK